MKMTDKERQSHRDAIIAEYGQGPSHSLFMKGLTVEKTNIAGVPWYFTRASEYKALKKQIAANRHKRRRA